MTAQKHHCLNEALEDGNIATSEDLKREREHTETEKTSESGMMVTYIPWGQETTSTTDRESSCRG